MRSSLQRFPCRLYTYQNAGSAGLMASTYVYAATRKASWVDKGGRAVVVGDRIEHVVERQAVFEWQAEVTYNGLFVTQDGKGWRIMAILDRPLQQQRVVIGVFVDIEPLHLA